MTTPTTEASTTPPRTHGARGCASTPNWASASCCWPSACSSSATRSPWTSTSPSADPSAPRPCPIVVGIGLLVVAVLLAVDVLRGGHGEAEGGEDVDLSEPADWRTVLLLTGVVPGLRRAHRARSASRSAGALLFWGTAFALGSRHHVRDPLIAAVLSLVTFFVFENVLGVPLPGGPLMGVL